MSDETTRPELLPDRLQRRLAAILSADVQGYSRLMGDNEEQTVQTLTAYRKVLATLVTQHHGRIVDMPGDNVLAEFASVIDAVQGAVHLQQVLRGLNSSLSPHRRMEFRIGVHLDDVLVEGERIYGDGVNIAARLEGLAPAGGVCLSGTVYDQVEHKLPFTYRFLGEHRLKNIVKPVRVYHVLSEVELDSPEAAKPISSPSTPFPPSNATLVRVPYFVGRAAELDYLDQCLETSLTGQRQIVFITGDPGIGKTTLIDMFLDRLRDRADLRIAYGQCVEQYGQSEAYLPLLEAANRLCRAPGGERLVERLKQFAPTWLVQMPSLLDQQDLASLQQRVQGFNRERMLREMAEAAELLAARRGVVLVIEDLHWSDTATLEWLAYIARRREAAKLLLLCAYRPADMLVSGSPLKSVVQELLARDQGKELRLLPLDEHAVQAYLVSRLTGVAASPEWTLALHRRTGGNPLFLVNMTDYLVQQGAIVEEDGRWRIQDSEQRLEGEVPTTLRRLIEKQFERLATEDQQLLEVASVEGREFVSAAVAAGLQMDVETVEEQCEQLARKSQFIDSEGVEHWPDGTIGGRYSFRHALYQNVLYERVAEARRVRLHRTLGIRKEQAYGKQAKEIAGELAAHFAAGRDFQRAVTYSKQAAETAVRRQAHQEAVAHLNQGLTHLQLLPDTPERTQQELMLQITLGEQITSLKGFGVVEVEQAFARARELCRRLGETPQLFRVMLGLWAFYVERAELAMARELAEQLLRIAQQVQTAGLLAWAHLTMGITQHFSGEQVSARQHLEQCLMLYDPQQFRGSGSPYDPAVLGYTTLGPVLWLLGYPEQALEQSQKGLTLARTLTQPYSEIYAVNLVTRTFMLRGESQAVHEHIEGLIALCREQGFASYLALSLVVQGWLLAEQEQQQAGIEQMQLQLRAWRTTGAESARPYYLALLAETYGKIGEPDKGLSVLAECWPWMEKTGGRVFEAELYRVRGELTLHQFKVQSSKFKVEEPHASISNSQAEAESYFLKALEIARQQQVKSLELRTVMSLACLWRDQGKISDARQLLEETYNWFTEGFDTKNLQEAAALLTELGGRVQPAESRKRKAAEEGRQKSQEQPPTSSVQRVEPEKPQALQPTVLSPHYALRPTQDAEAQASPVKTQLPTVFRREGEYWTITFAGETCRLRDNRGMRYLAQLLQRPNEELHSLQIAANDSARGVEQLEPSSRGLVNDLVDAEEKPLTGFSDAGEMLDPQARAAYKQRLADLQAELEEAQEFNDIGRIETLQEEMVFLSKELSHAVGLSGRVRKAGSVAERARVNVTKAIKTATKQIGKLHPALGQHLRQTIRTGMYCAYTPDPRVPMTWQT